MLSLRNVARSAPRALSRMTASTTAASALRQSVARPATASILRPVAASSFSTSIARFNATGETDAELAAKLDSEIQIEEDMKTQEQEPASVKDFLANTPFDLIDTPGQEIVKLTRSFGDEKITVSFSISDISNYDPYAQDPALEDDEAFDEESALQNQNKQSHVPASGGARSADAEQEMEEEEEDMDDAATPISLTVTVEKPGKSTGVMTVDATATNGSISVENMHYFDDAAIAKVESPDAAHKRADVYPGPPFGTLDEDLQVLVERYLEERGISQTLAVFVPDYVDVKEQREYVRWLNSVKAFVKA